MASRVLTVMFTDIKGFTERTSQSSRIELRDMLKEHEDLLLPVLADFDGRVVKTWGDAFVVVFESPTNAVLCGVMMQDRLRERNSGLPESGRLEVRVAINTGEVVERDADVFGEAVNIAARIEGITEASEIYFTESVYLAMNKAEVPSSEVGLRRLKGVPEAIKVYKVIQDHNSEQFRELIEKLRSGGFRDVSLPSTGEAAAPERSRVFRNSMIGAVGTLVACAVAAVVALVPRGPTTPGPDAEPAGGKGAEPSAAPAEKDPVLLAAKAVREAIESGEMGLALARADDMLKNHATRRESHDAVREVVAAEVAVLVEKDDLGRALDLIEERRKARAYVKFDELEREVSLKHGAKWAARGNYRIAGAAYGGLMRKYPDDIEILKAVVSNVGAGSKTGATRLGFSAAVKIAELTKGPLEEVVGRTLLANFDTYHPGHESAVAARRLLAERYPPAAGAARGELDSARRNTRMNAYLLLEALGRLGPDEELRVHVRNLLALRTTDSFDRKYLTLSVEYLEQASARADWPGRKKALDMGRITKVAALRSRNEHVDRLAALLVGAFLPEIRQTLSEWVGGDDVSLRVHAFHMLERAGLAAEVDAWEYHGKHLDLSDFSYQYPYLHEAIAFFKKQAGTPRAGEARALLAKAREAIARELKGFGDRASRHRNHEVNLKAVDEALKAFR